jgi:hypothetical protein
MYVYEVKNILKAIKEEGNKPETRQKYVEPLKKLENMVPKSKKDELMKLISKLEKVQANEQPM